MRREQKAAKTVKWKEEMKDTGGQERGEGLETAEGDEGKSEGMACLERGTGRRRADGGRARAADE